MYIFSKFNAHSSLVYTVKKKLTINLLVVFNSFAVSSHIPEGLTIFGSHKLSAFRITLIIRIFSSRFSAVFELSITYDFCEN